jgi:hypothetical protein
MQAILLRNSSSALPAISHLHGALGFMNAVNISVSASE